ncbi:MAG: hypothetical protein LKG11_00760 [Bacilli bacterium]|nr:hypothetical protein [Bacilli bacterium]
MEKQFIDYKAWCAARGKRPQDAASLSGYARERKAAVMARAIDMGEFDYFGRCYMKNRHYYRYDEDAMRVVPVSICQLASDYDMCMKDDDLRPSVMEAEAEMALAA